MRQTYTGEIECLIVDDCGTDGSIAIAEQIIAQYDGPIRFEVLHHEQNRGLSAARNTGTFHATGDYLYHLDSDDEITEDCVEKLIGKVENDPEVEMVQGNTIVHSIAKGDCLLVKNIPLQIVTSNEEARKCFYQYQQMHFSVWNKLFKRDFIIENNIQLKEGLSYFEESQFSFNILKYLKRAAYVLDCTYHYKQRPNSIMTATDKKKQGLYFVMLLQDVLTHLTPKHEKEEFVYFANMMGKRYFKYVREVPQLREELSLCRGQAKYYGTWQLRVLLYYISFLDQFEYGWVLWSMTQRIRHPKQIFWDFNRLWKKMMCAIGLFMSVISMNWNNASCEIYRMLTGSTPAKEAVYGHNGANGKTMYLKYV